MGTQYTFQNGRLRLLNRIFLISLLSSFTLGGCDCEEDCFGDPNLVYYPFINNIIIEGPSQFPIFIGPNYWPAGTSVVAINSINRFFSLERYNQFGVPVKFYWNELTPPPFNFSGDPLFSFLKEGEIVNYYVVIHNDKFGDLSCIFAEAKVIESVLSVRYRVQGGQVVGSQTIKEKRYEVPAGQFAVFKFPILFNGTGEYELDLNFSSTGFTEIDTTDNNYNIILDNLGSG